ncbi:MAG TPA: hypothetical protein VHW73_14475, partial [Rudaea sp.]|nr:hypothetical protein [Rudaea sp.]
DSWKENLEFVVMEGYSEVIGNVDLDAGTSANLDDAFRSRGSVDGQMLDKAVRFYLAALREIGITFSPHFGTRKVRKVARKAKTATQTEDAKKNNDKPDEQDKNKHDHVRVNHWHELLLQKFPNFDPSWDAEVQKKWLENFDALMKRGDN